MSAFVLHAVVALSFADDADLPRSLRSLERLGGVVMPSEKNEKDFAKLVDDSAKRFPQAPGVRYWQGDLAFRQRKLDRAAELWKLVADDRTADADLRALALERLAYIHLGKQDLAAAERDARAAVAAAPRLDRGYRCLYDVAFRSGQVEEVKTLVADAAAKHKNAAPTVVLFYHELLLQFGESDRLQQELDALPEAERRPEDYCHFQGRFAELAGHLEAAFYWHFLAYHGGPANAPTVKKSKQTLEKLRFREEADLPSGLLPMVRSFNALERPATAAEAFPAVGDALPGTQPRAQVVRYLQARALSAAGKPTAQAAWRALVDSYPRFAPALVGLAESLEATPNGTAEAEALMERARKLEPNNWKVREIDRTGVRWRPTADGVEAVSVDSDLAWGMFGFEPGCVVLELDGEKLADIPIEKRLSTVRLFQGGRVVYRPKGFTSSVTRDFDLVFFEW